MTRSLRLLFGFLLAVLLSSCAGHGTGVDEAADAAAASAAEHSGAPDVGGGPGDEGSTAAQPTGGNPGGPGGDPAGGGADVTAQGNPGAPGDVAVFEEEHAPYSALVNDAATKCADGVCRLKEPPIILDGHVERVEGGVGKCRIEKKTDILYDPQAQGDLFPHGATVRAQVHCAGVETPVDAPGGDSPAGDSPAQDPANPDAGTSAGATTTSDSTDQPQG
jgi:hypothetical protein